MKEKTVSKYPKLCAIVESILPALNFNEALKKFIDLNILSLCKPGLLKILHI